MEKNSKNTGVYVHFPFCLKKCPYCDFNSIAVFPVPEQDYVNALLKEINIYADNERSFPNDLQRKVHSIYFGGGTPSLFSADSIGEILNRIMSRFSVHSDIEITLEVNPKTADTKKIHALHASKVNRLSIGAQSFQERTLQALERIHGSADAIRIFQEARSVGFGNIGLDLIFGIPGQGTDDWKKDLDCIVSLRPEHVSVYNMTIEKNTPFYDSHRRGEIVLPDDDIQIEMYGMARDKLAEEGYTQYEISNFALPGFHSRHNEGYWISKDYLGFGAGAHSYIQGSSSEEDWGVRWKNISDPYEYMAELSSHGTALFEKERLGREEAIRETLFLGLRRLEGVKLDDFEKRFSFSLVEEYKNTIHLLVQENLVSIDGGRLTLTAQGILLSDEVFLKFFEHIVGQQPFE